MARNCLVVNIDRCTGCYGCQVACKMENGIPLGVNWNKVLMVGPVGEYPNMVRYPLPVMCQQCENAPCIAACPTGASYRDEENGLVLIDHGACIGCQVCMDACPYGVRSYNEAANVVEKCTCCVQRLQDGEKPACVVSCSTGARFFGDLDDPESDVSKELAKYDESQIHTLPDSGNGPLTKYIMTDIHGEWQELTSTNMIS